MLLIKILENDQVKTVTINQKSVSYFRAIDKEGFETYTLIKMCCGDSFVVIDPPFEQWQVDAYITDQSY